MAQQINLFNPIFLRQKKYFSAVTMLQALGMLLGGIIGFYGYAVYETRALAQTAAETSRQLKAQSDQLAKFTREFSPQGKSRLLEDEIARLSLRLKQGDDLLGLLRTGGLGNTAGFGRYLTAFAHRPVAGVWLTGFSIGGDESELVMNGRVLHPDLIPAYIRALNREEVMRGRNVSELRLTAREERDTAGTAAPGANPAVAARATPTRYVEFSLTASRRTAAAITAAGAPAGASLGASAGAPGPAPALPSVGDAVSALKGLK
ncbi:MAG: hypothetical protein HY017_27825 [Betaproteobacteria bacterium]|nr:hypothetical protein [Betaproteobacteria bacterium]